MIVPVGAPVVLYRIVLLCHVLSGFIGMYGGLVPLFTRKGGRAHRRWGVVFTWAMGIAALTAFPLAGWGHSIYQAGIGLFSGYLALFGYRVLRRHQAENKPWVDVVLAAVSGLSFLTMVIICSGLLKVQAEARAGLVFGVLGLIVVGRDLQGIFSRNSSFQRRIIDHLIASSLAVVAAFASFLNTQFYHLTHIDWPLDKKMLLPVVVALPLFAFWLPKWSKQLQGMNNLGDLLRSSPEEPSELDRIRALGRAEAITFLLLVGVAVPLKHLAGHPEFVRVMGTVHGAMFVLYATNVLLAVRALRWRWSQVALALVAAVLPFGPFVLEAYWDKKVTSLPPPA